MLQNTSNDMLNDCIFSKQLALENATFQVKNVMHFILTTYFRIQLATRTGKRIIVSSRPKLTAAQMLMC